MSIRSKRSSQKNKGNPTTTKLGIEQLESRLMNSIDALESSLQLLNTPGLFGSTQIVSNSTSSVSNTPNTPPSVASPLRLTSGTTVLGKSASLSVLGTDNSGESSLKYNWQVVEMPAGGNVTFASNRSNAAKNNLLSFNKPGIYGVNVTISDSQGLSSSSSLQFNVVQTLSSFLFKTSDGKSLASGTSLSSADTNRDLTILGIDQFGVAMTAQPSVSWQAIVVPAGGSATLSTNGNSVSAAFNRAGVYTLRARSGSIVSQVSINVTQTLKSIQLLTPDGVAAAPETPIAVEATNQRLTVRAVDQFGNAISTLPRVAWTTVSAPTGGAATVSITAGIATVTFTRAGVYSLRAQSGNARYSVAFDVSPVLKSAVAILANNRQLNSGASVPVAGSDIKLGVRGLDQFNQPLPTQPDFAWSFGSAQSGAYATLTQTANDADLRFQRAGIYVARASSGKATLNVTLHVLQTVTSLVVTPGTSSVPMNASQQYRYQTQDQFGHSISNQATATWTTTVGTITKNGTLNSGTRTGTFVVTAKVGTVSGRASLEVTAPAPTPTPTPAPTPAPTPNPTPSPLGLLRNSALSSLVSSLYSDSQLTRTEMIQVLRNAGSDGVVDGSELEDLRYLTSTSSVFAMPAYVRELAKDVVNSNPANRTFKGQSAGNLVAGSSSTLLNNLVDKWFLGADEPVLTNSSLSYQIFVGNLFNGTPSRNDAKQGQLGDCYFIAALSAIADRNPDAVRNLFIDNNDGSYTVRFYDATRTVDYVTVNRRLPTNSEGRLEYSGYGLSVSSSATTGWIALAEKAYAQWNETGNEGRDGTNRYSSIEGGWMSYVNAQVLGTNSSNYSFSTTPKQTLISAITASKSITLGTLQNATGGLVGGHAYTVAGYNASTDTFTLFNPWGTSHPSPLTWAQLQSNCSMFTVADASGSVANSLASVRSSIDEAFVGIWTTVVVATGTDAAGTENRETHEMEEQEPILLILGSSLDGEANSRELALSVAVSSVVDNIVDAVEDRLVAPLSASLSASLVDLAMSQLKRNAI